jgi:hypothetical protein
LKARGGFQTPGNRRCANKAAARLSGDEAVYFSRTQMKKRTTGLEIPGAKARCELTGTKSARTPGKSGF